MCFVHQTHRYLVYLTATSRTRQRRPTALAQRSMLPHDGLNTPHSMPLVAVSGRLCRFYRRQTPFA